MPQTNPSIPEKMNPTHDPPQHAKTTEARIPLSPATPASLDAFRSEGDLNLSARRRMWTGEHLGPEATELLAQDAKFFLHQSLSTPCLNVLRHAEGSWIEDIEGRRY